MKKIQQATSDKILITIPFWEGDRYQVEILVKLLADLQKNHSDRADILFVRRFDTKPLKPEIIKYVSRKFNVLQHRSARKETGWPCGCNGLFFGSLEYIYHMQTDGRIPQYKAFFNMAADVVPLRVDWIDYLQAKWDKLQKLQHPVKTAGAFLQGPEGTRDHINGDAMLFSTEPGFLRWLAKDVGGIRVRAGWDWVLAADFERHGWSNVEGIRSLWQTETMPRAVAEEWIARGVVLIHGVKDDSLLKHARSFLL